MDNTKIARKYYTEEITKLLDKIDNVDDLVYIHTFIKHKFNIDIDSKETE